jgi:diguanylate cyclase (GGDEF)-like protein
MAKLRPVSMPASARVLLPFPGSAPAVVSLAATVPAAAIQIHWPFFVLALVTTAVTLALLLSFRRAPASGLSAAPRASRRDRRRSSVAGRRDAREALALVGDALAATHNPRALLPVILNVIVEATGARGGQLVHEGEEIGWAGDLDPRQPSVEFDLSAGDETRATKLVLHAPEGGFGNESLKLAEWLSSQAAIALENARLHDIIQHQAMTDELTGLVNRRRFLAALQAEIARVHRLGGPLSVVLADLDDFKSINDRYGHHGGDDVLQAFADVIRAHGRDVDVAARLGGEEFAVLLPETALGGAAAGAERLCRSLSQLRIWLGDGREVSVTASFGVAELADGQSWDGFLQAADAALYRAKAQGKNCVALAGEASAA